MFAAIDSKINSVISNLHKKNLKTSTQELNQLLRMGEGRVTLLTSLFDDIDFRDQKSGVHKDIAKVSGKGVYIYVCVCVCVCVWLSGVRIVGR